MDNITSQIQASLGVHPAIRLPFDELYAGIMAEVTAGNLTRLVKDDLELFNYTRNCSFEKNWNVFTLISRGLILCPSQKKVVCQPLIKFFNYGETLYLPENESFRSTTKMDGSCIFLWFWNNKWNCSTRGSFSSEQAIWAENWFHTNCAISELVPGRTYIFEVIYAENRIVITYDFEGLVLITGYDENGNEFLYDDAAWYASRMGTRVVQTNSFNSIEEMLDKSKELPSSEEGWVVRFDNGYRIKIKGDEYCRIHRVISNCTPLSVWDMMRNCQDLAPIIAKLPEEFRKDIRSIRKIMQDKEHELLQSISFLVDLTKNMTDKDLGLAIPYIAKVWPVAAYFLFSCRKNDFMKEGRKPGKFRNSLYKRFRPTANALEGYVPSSAMNRFEEDS